MWDVQQRPARQTLGSGLGWRGAGSERGRAVVWMCDLREGFRKGVGHGLGSPLLRPGCREAAQGTLGSSKPGWAGGQARTGKARVRAQAFWGSKGCDQDSGPRGVDVVGVSSLRGLKAPSGDFLCRKMLGYPGLGGEGGFVTSEASHSSLARCRGLCSLHRRPVGVAGHLWALSCCLRLLPGMFHHIYAYPRTKFRTVPCPQPVLTPA